jgi:replicative DNA helicase
MSIGFGLIKSIIEKKEPIAKLYEEGIDETYFKDDEKAALEFVKDHKSNYDTFPSLETVAAEAGNPLVFNSLPVEPVGYWAKQLRERKQQTILANTQARVYEFLSKQNIEQAKQALREGFEVLSNTESGLKVKDLHELQYEVIQIHNERQIDPDLPGISFGFPSLDDVTGGNQEGDLNLLVGETGVCKSYISAYTALSAYLHGSNVMLVSPEMSESQMARRILSLQGNFQDRLIKRGRLSYYAIEKAKNIIAFSGQRDNKFQILPSGMSSDINQIIAIASEFKPQLLVIDGIYLINDYKKKGSHWEEAESVYKKLKDVALNKSLAVLATTQYNTANAKKIEGARSTQSARQIASSFLSLEFENEEDKETQALEQTRLLKTKKTRDGDHISLRISIDFNRSIIKEDSVLSGPESLEEDDTPIVDDKHIDTM